MLCLPLRVCVDSPALQFGRSATAWKGTHRVEVPGKRLPLFESFKPVLRTYFARFLFFALISANLLSSTQRYVRRAMSLPRGDLLPINPLPFFRAPHVSFVGDISPSTYDITGAFHVQPYNTYVLVDAIQHYACHRAPNKHSALVKGHIRVGPTKEAKQRHESPLPTP